MKRRAGMHAPRAFIHSSIRSHTVGSPIPSVITSSYHHITSSHKRVCVQSFRAFYFTSHFTSRHLRVLSSSSCRLLASTSRRGTQAEADGLFSSRRPPSHTHHLAYHIIPTYPCQAPRIGAWVSRLLPTLGHVARGQVSSIDETQPKQDFVKSKSRGWFHWLARGKLHSRAHPIHSL